MNTQQTHELLYQATRQLAVANEELNRPMEDVMSYSICHSVRKSTEELFRVYLSMNNISADNANSLESLRERCASANREFNKLDLSLMNCAVLSGSTDAHFCLGIDQVKSCLEVANKLQKLVLMSGVYKRINGKAPQ